MTILSWSTIILSLTFETMYKSNKTLLSFFNLNLNSSMMSYNKIILNLFLFRTILFSMINICSLHMFIMSLSKHIMPLQNQIQRKMMISIHMLSLYFPSPSSNVGKRSFTTSIELVLDMTRK